MFIKIVTIVFYAGLALFFFHVAFPFLNIILGVCAIVLLIVSL